MSDQPHDKPLPQQIDVAAALDEALSLLPADVEAVLIGGLALAFHGIERYTKDVDLALRQTDSARVEANWPGKDPRPLRIGGVSLQMANGVRADFIDRRHDYAALFEALLEAASVHPVRAITRDKRVLVAPIAYMIALKLAADRPQDEADLQRLLALPNFDYREARAIVSSHLGPYAAQRLDKLARIAGRADAPKDYSHEPS